jgi:hypothetical protein
VKHVAITPFNAVVNETLLMGQHAIENNQGIFKPQSKQSTARSFAKLDLEL